MGPARFLNGLSITGDLTVTGNILPGANNTYNIGSTTAAWKIGYFRQMSLGEPVDMTGASVSSYVLYVNGKSNFTSDANFVTNITVGETSNLQGNVIVGTTSGAGLDKTLTVNGKVVINPSYNDANNSYNEGIRINQASNGWAEVVFGGAAGSIANTGTGIWLAGTKGNNFYLSYSGNETSANRLQATPNGYRLYSSGSSSAVQTGTLTLGSTDSAWNGSGSGGDVALEFWRGKNASWQIINTGGDLWFRNNYNTAAQATYNQNTLMLGYGSRDSVIYTSFRPNPPTGSKQSTLNLGSDLANWNALYVKDINFGYDSTDQYLAYTGKTSLNGHSGVITLYRLLPSGTSGTASSGTKLRPGVLLDASTGLISLEHTSAHPTASASARIQFKYFDSASSLGQNVFLSYSASDSYRAPYGLKVWSDVNTAPYTWFEVEGSMYIGTHTSAVSSSNVDTNRLATSLYIRNRAALSGYDDWLRLNDLIGFTNGVYTPSMVQTNTGFTFANSDTANPSTFYFKTYNDTTTSTKTEIQTTKTVVGGLISLGSGGDMASADFPVYISDKTLFTSSIHVYGTSNMAGSSAGYAYHGGMYHAGHNSIVLHGDTSGSSGILFMSTTGINNSNINSPSDRAFIQYHPYGVTNAVAEGTTAPTLAASGEAGRFVIGIGNDATDYLVLQTPSVDGLKHQVGTTTYTVATLNATVATANYPVITTTTAGLVTHNTNIIMNGNALTVTNGTVTATTFVGSLQGNADTATKAAQDSRGQAIDTTYIKDISFGLDTSDNKYKYTITKGSGTTSKITPVVAQIIRW